MNVCYDQTGRTIRLADRALAGGGEGEVYEIAGYPQKLVKKYRRSADAQKREAKIREMVRIGSCRAFSGAGLARDTAWPLAEIFDQNRRFIGFGMNRIAFSTNLGDLYAYPAAQNVHVTVKDRIDCLISLSDVVGRLHRAGLVFGDGNPDNLKIRDDYSVCFIDVDSFHFQSGGVTYKCEVCAPGYAAPELIRACRGSTYAKCPGPTFTQETDNFALAVHCFRMLMHGAHPFACQRQRKGPGSAPAPKPMDRRVECGETPFFKRVPDYTTPAYAPDLRALPPYVQELFRRAFVDGHNNPKARPTPDEWKRALTRFRGELTRCAHDPTHYFWSANASCPYCEADNRYAGKASACCGPAAAPSPTAASAPTATPTPAPMPAPAATPAPTATPAPAAVRTPAYTPPAAAGPAPAARAAFGWPAARFWAMTLLLSMAVLAALCDGVLPQMYDSIANNALVTRIGTAGGCIAGFAGMTLYNACWAPGRLSGRYRWYEYALSVLACLGFTFGFGLVMGLVYLAAVIFYHILMAAIVLGIIVAILAGG